MSSKSNELENDLLQLLFNNVIPGSSVLTNIGSGIQASSTAGSLHVSLHTADVGETGSQTTSEMTIQNYARIAVARSTAGWTVSTNNASNAAQIRFPASGTFGATNAPQDARFFAIGTAATGAGHILYTGHLGDDVNVFNANASTDQLDVEDNPYSLDDEVFIFEVPGEALPTGISRGIYFVLTPSADLFQISTTQGGAAVNFTGDGSGYIARLVPRTLDNGDAFTFEIGDLDVFED